MSFPEWRRYKIGKLDETIYDFVAAGDEIENHTHGPDDCHITIVQRGSIKATGSWGELILTAGQQKNWKPGEDHALIALEPNTRIYNIIY